MIADGRLYWMRDAYTATGNYPYSTPVTGGINYIRNSVKIIIDAYNGDTTFYLAEPDDPIAVTLGKIFPGWLQPLDAMPESLRDHIRYPEGIFSLQTAIYSTFHMSNPAVFYNREDQWEVPVIDNEQMEPYYTIMRLPGEERAEFIQMLPFTPRGKNNLAAWMVARSDGENYGRMFVFQFPKQKLIFGPSQIVARINQDQVISPQITLWNQQGSEVIQGTLLVIPIEEALLYVRPMYLRASGGRIPQLTRVIVAYQNQIVMEETLDRALERLFSDAPPGLGPPTTNLLLTDAAQGVDPVAGGDLSALAAAAAASSLATQARDRYTSACRRSVKATGRSTAKKSSASVRSSRSCRTTRTEERYEMTGLRGQARVGAMAAAALAVAALTVAACGPSEPEVVEPTPGLLAFTGAKLITGEGGAIDNGTMVVRDGMIEAVGAADAVEIPADAATIDLTGRVVTPGLINAHGHVNNVRGLEADPSFYTEEHIEHQLGLYARYGITTVASLGGGGPAGVAVRNREDAGLTHARLRLSVR